MTLQSDIADAAAQIQADEQKLKGIVNGPASGAQSLVTVDSGLVKTVARAISEIGDTSNQALQDLSNVADGDFVTKAGTAGVAGDMEAANNLADLPDPSAARTELGLGAAAVEDVAAGGVGDLLREDGDGSSLTGISTSDIVARANIVLNAFRIAVNGGLSVLNMVDGVIDEFEDETGVDGAGSTNEFHDTIYDYYTNGYWSSDVFTGGTAAASTERIGGNAAWLYDDDLSAAAYWETALSNPNGWNSYDFAGAATKVIKKYMLHCDAFATGGNLARYPKTWTFEGYNGSSWTVLDTQTNAPYWTTGETREFELSNTTAYEKYKIDVTANQGDGNCVQINEMEGFEWFLADMTLVSNATTAETQPDEAFMVVWEEDIDSITLNTDLKAWVSRDGGTTYTQFTLSEEADLSTGRILTGTADISGQPAGTSMVWKITTHNTRELRLHGVGLEWS